MSKKTYYIHKILYCGGDWSDSSPEIDEIFGVNHDSDGEGLSGGDTVEVGSLSLNHMFVHALYVESWAFIRTI